jgi:hypothetical protein
LEYALTQIALGADGTRLALSAGRAKRGLTLDHALRIFASIGKFLRREFAAAWPVFLFFVVGFLLLLLIIKLALASFSIEITPISKIVVGALVAAKAVLILDETPLERHLEQSRRIIAVAVKTFLYGFITLLLGCVERFVDALRHEHSFDGAVRYLFAQASLYRLLAWAVGISLVFAIYFALFEIDQRMGRGALRALFFDSPKTAGSATVAQLSSD